VDLLVTEGENEYVLEVNTLPGMTPTSLLPKIAESAGMDYGALCEAILDGAELHASMRAASKSERSKRDSGVTFSERDLSLVKKAV
jgi:D-alanine-D-alanine ligase